MLTTIQEIAKKFPVDKVILFGSQAKRETLDPSSDVDLAFIFKDEFETAKRREIVTLHFIWSELKYDIIVFSRSQYNQLLSTASRVSDKSKDPWIGPSNPAYQVYLGKTIFDSG